MLTTMSHLLFEEGDQPSAGGGGTPDPAPAGAPAPGGNYPEGLLPEYRDSEALQKFANEDGTYNVGKTLNSYIQLEKHLGKDRISIPKETSTPEEWKATFTALGLPESVEAYDIKNNIEEGFTADESLFNGFKNIAHEVGILPHQAQKVLDYYNEQSVTGHKASQVEAKAQAEAATEGLKQEWGQQYEMRKTNAVNALGQFVSQEELTAIQSKGLSPQMLKIFDGVAKGMGEDTFTPEGKGNFGMSQEDVLSNITKLQSSEALKSPLHPEYKVTMDKLEKLLTISAEFKK